MIWNMAALRQRQYRKPYKVCGPVGEDADNRVMALTKRFRREDNKDYILTDGFGGQYFRTGETVRGEHPVYECCGHHVCSCPPKPASFEARMSMLEGLQALGMLAGADRNGAIRLLLTGEGAESLAARTQRYEAQLPCTRPLCDRVYAYPAPEEGP